MRVKGRTLGAWFNQKRFSQRKAKGYALNKRFDHRLFRWFNYLLFRLLPPEWYLRTQGIKLAPNVAAVVVYYLHDQVKMAQLELGINMIMDVIPMWFEHGFYEPRCTEDDGKRYYIPPSDILGVTWYDPVLKDDISIDGPWWRPA